MIGGNMKILTVIIGTVVALPVWQLSDNWMLGALAGGGVMLMHIVYEVRERWPEIQEAWDQG